MTRIGKQPIHIPAGIKVSLNHQTITVSGPKGTLTLTHKPGLKVETTNNQVLISSSGPQKNSQLHGVTRTLVANMVKGIAEGWSKTLEISGTGFRASVSGNNLTLNVGFSHPVIIIPPPDISFEVKENKIIVNGIDKSLVGEIASKIRKTRPPDPYKAKGIKYLGEKIRRKAGKAAKASGTPAK